jgi:tetratricopeptide (TPR) repeat protein
MVLPLISLAVAAQDSEIRLKELFCQVFALHNEGRNSEAIEIAKEALKIAEEMYGSEHPNMFISFNNLSYLYDYNGQCAVSELLYKRALKILKKSLGPSHFRVGTVLNNMAACFRKNMRKQEAEKLEAQAMEIQSGIEHDMK